MRRALTSFVSGSKLTAEVSSVLALIAPASLALIASANVAAAQAGPCRATEIISTTPGHGTPWGYSRGTAISADGRFVAFHSDANTFEGYDVDKNDLEDVFLHDRQLITIKRVSLGLTEHDTNGASFHPSLSADGRYVAFESAATNLIASDTNGQTDIYVCDRQTGVFTRVSVASNGTPADGASDAASISDDGQLVAFVSTATNLVPGDTNGMPDVFVHDRASGQTTRVNVTQSGTQADGFSRSPEISADGRFVAFATRATNLVPGDVNAAEDVVLHDRLNGQLTHVSVDSAGNQANGESYSPSVSADGRYIAFTSEASNLISGDGNGASDIFVRDRQSLQTTRVSVGELGQEAEAACAEPAISADGRFVAFASFARNLIVDKGNLTWDVFQRDVQAGTTRIISTHDDGTPEHYLDSRNPTTSADGRAVTFEKPQEHWDPLGYFPGVFLRDCSTDFVISPFCFGDGVSHECPCANGAFGSGCANSFYPQGARLTGSGVASVSADSVLLQTSSMSGTIAFFLQGTRWGAGELHDGFECLGGTLLRIGLKPLAVGGICQNPEPGDLSISIRGGVPASGGTRYYQSSYRNVASYCTSATLNWSNAVRITWVP